MQTIIRVNKREHPFAQIDRRILENKRMSWKAKGLLCYLLSRPNDWSVVIADLINRSSDGRDSVYAALNELCEFGYAKHEQIREKGKIVGSRWLIDESAGLATSGKTVSGFSVSGFAVSGKSDTTNKNDPTDKKKAYKEGVQTLHRTNTPSTTFSEDLNELIFIDGNGHIPVWKVRGYYREGDALFFADGQPWLNPSPAILEDAPRR